jgi:hypothetical protein
MGTGRTFNKQPRTRPKKKPADRRRREKIHRERLIALGMDAEAVNKMNPKEVRTALKRPAKVAAAS